jgi:hypothetical protein
VLPPAELVQRDDYGALYRHWDGRQEVRVCCPSTGAVYWLPASPGVRTAREAVAETFGLIAADYSPSIES